MAILDFIKWLLILFTVAIACGFLYALYQAWRFHPRFQLQKQKARKITTLRSAVTHERWRLITKRFSLGTPESMRIAVIEADALVDAALKDMDLPGEHLADRLSNLEADEIKSLEGVWRAHRFRNDLVHTPGFALSPGDAKATLDNYEAFLKEIAAL